MVDEEAEEKGNEDVEKKSGSSTLKIVVIAVTLAVLLGGGLVGGTFYLVSNMNDDQNASTATKKSKAGDEEEGDEEDEDEDEEEGDEDEDEDAEPAAPPQYHSMDPKFVVSFSDQTKARFMQFSLEIMTRDDEAIKQIQAHMPVVRSSLLMLFSSQGYEEMSTREGKEKLLQDTVANMNATLHKISGAKEQKEVVEAAYFNSFVVQ